MLVVYVSGHGYGHMTRVCEVLRTLRMRDPELGLTVVSAAPEALVRRTVPGPVAFRPLECDVGLAQKNALVIDEEGTAERCREFEASWDDKLSREVDFLRRSRARLVLGDIPPLAFAAAGRAGVPSIGLGNFSWDWIYRHLASRQYSLFASARRAAEAYAEAELLLELPFAGDLSAFSRREQIGLVARRPRIDRDEVRRRLGLDSRPAIVICFGGVVPPGLAPEAFASSDDLRFLRPEELAQERMDSLGLGFPDLLGAVEVVVTKPGYGIVTDAIAAGTRMVYTERGDFPEYPIMVREMERYLACIHVGNRDLHAGRLTAPIRRVLSLPMPEQPDLDGADRAVDYIMGHYH